MDVHSDQVAEATISAVVIRADGTVEDLGVLDSYKRPPRRLEAWWGPLLRRIRWQQS